MTTQECYRIVIDNDYNWYVIPESYFDEFKEWLSSLADDPSGKSWRGRNFRNYMQNPFAIRFPSWSTA